MCACVCVCMRDEWVRACVCVCVQLEQNILTHYKSLTFPLFHAGSTNRPSPPVTLTLFQGHTVYFLDARFLSTLHVPFLVGTVSGEGMQDEPLFPGRYNRIYKQTSVSHVPSHKKQEEQLGTRNSNLTVTYWWREGEIAEEGKRLREEKKKKQKGSVSISLPSLNSPAKRSADGGVWFGSGDDTSQESIW